jgi:hypothetical protein
MANKSGEVNWSDTVLFDPNKSNGKKDEWMRLKEGTNLIRVLTLPHQYSQHTYAPEGGKKYGYRVNCSSTKETGCPLCEQDNKPKRRWLIGVIDRETNMYKILDASFTVFKGIKNLNDDPDWGDPSTYDISIINAGDQAGPTRYSAVAKPKKPLSASDLAIQAENGTDALVRRTTPPTYEQVQARLAKITEEIGGNGGGSDSSNQSDDEDDDSSNFFKDYDSKKKSA